MDVTQRTFRVMFVGSVCDLTNFRTGTIYGGGFA